MDGFGELLTPLEPEDGSEDFDIGELENSVEIEFDDGSVEIQFGAAKGFESKSSGDFDENLSEILDEDILSDISKDLLKLIENDNESRAGWLETIANGMDLLGLKLRPGGSNDDGMSNVNSPLLLEAVLTFQSNARGELLPAGGPVKVKVDGPSNEETNKQANALEIDMNHYLTSKATEYYPDTDKLLFMAGYGGSGFKKVYMCPVRCRPVSESVEAKDLIVNNSAFSIETAARITHKIKMRPNQIKRMEILGVYRSIDLSQSFNDDEDVVTEKKSEIAGISTNIFSYDTETDRDIYECYCELNIEGFEHKIDGKITGLLLPYRVTIDVESEEILEIRRWYNEGDDMCTRRESFVQYTFNPAMGFYGIGLVHMLGNSTRALTAGWRMAMDAGTRGNFPGFLYAKSAGKQLTSNFKVMPGHGVPIETNGMRLSDAVMPLPYRDVSGAFIGLLNEIDKGASKLGGTAEIAVGEGNQDAPVGTTLALIDQATKIMSAAHKRLHAAQQKEFQLLKELFKENPEAFFDGGTKSGVKWDATTLLNALNNNYLVPAADPNVASQMQRLQQAVAIGQMAAASPQLFDLKAVASRVFTMSGIEDYQSLFASAPPVAPPIDPVPMIEAQAKTMTAKARADQVKVNAVAQMQKQADNGMDRESKEAIEMAKLARVEAIHPESVGGPDSIIPVIEAAMKGFASTSPDGLGGLGNSGAPLNPFELQTQSVNQDLYSPNQNVIE